MKISLISFALILIIMVLVSSIAQGPAPGLTVFGPISPPKCHTEMHNMDALLNVELTAGRGRGVPWQQNVDNTIKAIVAYEDCLLK